MWLHVLFACVHVYTCDVRFLCVHAVFGVFCVHINASCTDWELLCVVVATLI